MGNELPCSAIGAARPAGVLGGGRRAARARGLSPGPVDDFRADPGTGVSGRVGTHAVVVGRELDPALPGAGELLETALRWRARGRTVAFVIVDSTGWFAEYQDAEAGLGTVGARTLAAQKLVEHGFAADRSAVMVSTTHVHAAPTITGSWGTSTATPEGRAYLKRVHDAVAAAFNAPDVKDLMARQGNVINVSSTEHAQQFFKTELARYAALVKKAGVELQ